MDTTLSADRVPPFQQTPLIVWGPAPEGTTHPERPRTYDLQHQATTVRFDWSRHAVVGTTTLSIGGLPRAASDDGAVVNTNGDGSRTLSQIRFSGKKYALAIGGDTASAQ